MKGGQGGPNEGSPELRPSAEEAPLEMSCYGTPENGLLGIWMGILAPRPRFAICQHCDLAQVT